MHVDINGKPVPTWLVIVLLVLGRFVYEAMVWLVRKAVKR